MRKRPGKERRLHSDLASATTELWEHHNGRHDIINDRLKSLETMAHPPMPYLVCGECHCLVQEREWANHAEWHNKLRNS